MDNNVNFTPVFIIGVAHSGTTILQRILSRHPNTTWFSQYSLRSGEIPGRISFPLSQTIDKTLRQITTPTWEKRFSALDHIIPTPNEPQEIFSSLIPGAEEDRRFFTEADAPTIDSARIQQTLREFSKTYGKSHLVAKWPPLTNAVRLLRSIFPQAYFVHIIRDGRAIALSFRPKDNESGDVSEKVMRIADYWRNTVNHIHEAKDFLGNSLYEITYEQLCADLHNESAHIAQFVGLAESANMLSNIPESLSVTNQKRFDHATEQEMNALNNVLEKELKRYSYTL